MISIFSCQSSMKMQEGKRKEMISIPCAAAALTLCSGKHILLHHCIWTGWNYQLSITGCTLKTLMAFNRQYERSYLSVLLQMHRHVSSSAIKRLKFAMSSRAFIGHKNESVSEKCWHRLVSMLTSVAEIETEPNQDSMFVFLCMT